MQSKTSIPGVAIACGGTGGHLFPGVAVGEELKQRGCAVILLISPKEVDQKAVQGATGMRVATLPAVALSRGKALAFARGFTKSYRAARKSFQDERPDAVLAMGGFTSAPPILAGRAMGALTFLHESNTIPGRANRWLSWIVNQAFIGFPEASARLYARNVKVTGTPVRPQFQLADAGTCRLALGLDPLRPVLLVTGGSQGAEGLNDLVIRALPFLAKLTPEVQLFHLTGVNQVEKVERACAEQNLKAIVKPFFAEMHLVLGAASVVISRAGASSLAEIAAMRVPGILVPLPTATDNHQFFNAQAFEKTGAALLMPQCETAPEFLAQQALESMANGEAAKKMRAAQSGWHAPHAAGQIAESILQAIALRRRATGGVTASISRSLENHRMALS